MHLREREGHISADVVQSKTRGGSGIAAAAVSVSAPCQSLPFSDACLHKLGHEGGEIFLRDREGVMRVLGPGMFNSFVIESETQP